MYLYIFENGNFVTEMILVNHSDFEITQVIKESLDKYGKKSVALVSRNRFFNPRLTDEGIKEE